LIISDIITKKDIIISDINQSGDSRLHFSWITIISWKCHLL